MEPIEGYFVESAEGLIFDVKGLVHPPGRVVAYVRYVPDPEGEREHRGLRYKKVYSLRDREELLRRRYPRYLHYDPVLGRVIQSVPLDRVAEVYDPVEKLEELSSSAGGLAALAVELAEIVAEESGIPRRSIGVTGSLLVGMHAAHSDIDLVVYGEREGRRAYEALSALLRAGAGGLEAYGARDLARLYEFRSRDTRMDFGDFARVESRKVLQGKFRDRDFYVRLVKRKEEYGEEYGELRYSRVGRCRIRALVVDDADSIFTPCRYAVEVLEGPKVGPLVEVVSYRGRFCEQAKEGEEIVAEGTLERVEGRSAPYYRLVVGESRYDFVLPR